MVIPQEGLPTTTTTPCSLPSLCCMPAVTKQHACNTLHFEGIVCMQPHCGLPSLY